MNLLPLLRRAAFGVLAAVTALAGPARADDIDIFLTPQEGNQANSPAVLFVIDNTSNWSRQSQKWPGGLTQGQSEVQAISDAIASLDEKFRVGLMEFGTEGTANQNGGFIAFDVSPMTPDNKATLQAMLARIKANINDPKEKLSSGREYGDLLRDVNQYVAGGNTVFGNANVWGPHADSRGYTTNYTQFASPLVGDDGCGEVVIVFVSNPDSSGPTGDTELNTEALKALGGDTAQIQLPQFTTTTATTNTTLISETSCLKPAQCPSATTAAGQCSGATATYDSCSCTQLANTSGCTTKGKKDDLTYRFRVDGQQITTTVTPTGTFAPPPVGTGNAYPNADEWSRYFFQKGVVLPNNSRKFLRTYTIDVFNAQQNADHTALMQSMARVGGGKYFEARSQSAILDAINDIFSDIQSVNSTFTSAALPISATNRSQSDNQVYIGMFRPDPASKPRWFGNLKQYQLVAGADGGIQLGDADRRQVVNPLTGFVSECSRSYWAVDTGNYFVNTVINPSPQSLCVGTPNSVFSDSPDGPRVEKGGVAMVLRMGNNPPTTSTTPDFVLRRDVKTESAGAMVAFDTTSTSLPTITVDFTRGRDTQSEYIPQTPTTPTVQVRPSVHGDVIHSRPQPVNYGGTTGTVVYYGANDGHLRAVRGSNGQELWSFVAPEHKSKLERLRTNAPDVVFPMNATSLARPAGAKDYFFDGSIGVYQTANNSAVNIYASMRRGGRMVYGFDVTTPTSPLLLWKAGCPNLDNDTGCTTGMTGIGQTWATPAVGMVKGYNSGTRPVVFVAGGHDNCEDENTRTPSCGSAKGRVIYALDGIDGTVQATLNLPGASARSVVADLALVDINLDGLVDAVYAADMGGNVYRVDLADPLTVTERAKGAWTISRIAYTAGAGRKFQFAPALTLAKNTVYVAIGTGDREHPLVDQYPYATSLVNRFYLFVDKFDGSDLNLDDASLLNNLTTGGSVPTDCSAEPILPAGTKKGWFFDLTDNGRGEQVVTSAAIVGGLVAFSTNRPTPEPVNSCAANLGEARGYLVNLLSGSGAIDTATDCGGDRSVDFVGGGLPPSPVITRVNIDGVVRTVCIGCAQKDGRVSSSIEAQRIKPLVKSVRKPTYWLSPNTAE
jgi:type IV pilus assembly protein PilY1